MNYVNCNFYLTIATLLCVLFLLVFVFFMKEVNQCNHHNCALELSLQKADPIETTIAYDHIKSSSLSKFSDILTHSDASVPLKIEDLLRRYGMPVLYAQKYPYSISNSTCLFYFAEDSCKQKFCIECIFDSCFSLDKVKKIPLSDRYYHELIKYEGCKKYIVNQDAKVYDLKIGQSKLDVLLLLGIPNKIEDLSWFFEFLCPIEENYPPVSAQIKFNTYGIIEEIKYKRVEILLDSSTNTKRKSP